ncbi:hypothetical protein FA95DRAFT_1605915 [Auriscalpium vulgare]|uniref:Uncharacterized protein n=1 Tax=Auriscalpium vulgare TaxID=40419 RepID=A0ACB8RVC1_9AGAM|nr:hypothetical protein FA95DRAFT_1605915 [Auriscalpium vulgare]
MFVIAGGYILRREDVRALIGHACSPPVQPTEEDEEEGEPLPEDTKLFMDFDFWYSRQPEELKLPIPNCFYNAKEEMFFYLPITLTRARNESFRKPEVASAHPFRDRFIAATGGKFSAENMVWRSLPVEALVAPLARYY